MNIVETGTLLVYASGFDRFIVVDDVTTASWWSALGGVDFEMAKQAVVNHYTGPDSNRQLTVGNVLDGVALLARRTTNQIAADVRSARARRLVSMDWPEDLPLDDDVAAQLEALRDTERIAARRREAEELGTLETEDAPPEMEK